MASTGRAGSAVAPLAGLNESIGKVSSMVGLYQKRANSEIRTQSELESARREMKVIKGEILSELARSKGMLQRLQKG